VVTQDLEVRDLAQGIASPAIAPRLISCCPEELVDAELDALRQGGERARADGAGAEKDMTRIAEAATDACDRALAEQYIPLDEKRFREVFTLAWCAGYHAEVQRSRPRTTSPAKRP
jgi:hypothetical protein